MTPALQRQAADDQNPWPGLAAFDEAAHRFFNGRSEECAVLRRLVLQAPLTVLFGASGTGKTSLVQAGLFPLLRREILPVYVRLDFHGSTGSLIEQARSALEAQIQARRVEAPAFEPGESLWSWLHRDDLELWSEQNQLLMPLFVFDQFEEIFTLGASQPAAIATLRADLADLIENRLPDAAESGPAVSVDSQRYRVLLSFREDFLPAIEGWRRDLPSLARNRLRLLPMSGQQAFEAVHATAPEIAPEPIARRIVEFVAAAGENAGGSPGDLTVEPALLSLVCRGLNDRRKKEGKTAIDDSLLSGAGQSIVADFYAGAVAGLPSRVSRFIESELITERGFRKPCDVDDARTVHGLTNDELALLVNRRLLRIEHVRGAERVELTHDLLTRVVREHRDRSRERQRKRRLWLIGLGSAAVALFFLGLYFQARRLQVKAEKALEDLQRAQSQVSTAESRKTSAEEKAAAADEAYRNASRTALTSSLATAALRASNDPSGVGILFALNSVLVGRTEGVEMPPNATDALRNTVDAIHQLDAPKPIAPDRAGHGSEVTRAAFSSDNSRIATAAQDGVRIWGVKAGDELSFLPDCDPDAFNEDLSMIACRNGYSGRFVDLKAPDKTIGFPMMRVRLGQMAFGPGGILLWQRGGTLSVRIGESTQTFKGLRGVFDGSGKFLAAIDDSEVNVYDLRTGSPVYTRKGRAQAAAWSADGKRLAISYEDDPPRVVSIELPSTEVTIPAPGPAIGKCLAFSPTGLLATAGKELWVLSPTAGPQQWPFAGRANEMDCLFPRNDRIVIVWSAVIDVIEPRELKPVSLPEVDIPGVHAHRGVSRDLKLTADSSEGGISINSISESGQNTVTSTLPAKDEKPVQGVAISSDGGRAVVSGSDNRAYVFDTASGKRLYTLIGHSSPITFAAYSPDGRYIATSAMDGPKLWDAQSGHMLQGSPEAQMVLGHRPLALEFTPDSKRLALVLDGGPQTNAIWDLDLQSHVPVPAPADNTRVHGIAFSGDGKHLITTSAKLGVFETNGTPLWSSDPVSGMYVPTSNRSGSVIAVSTPQGIVLVARGSKPKPLPGTPPGNVFRQLRFAFSPDGNRLAAPLGNAVGLWNAATGDLVATLPVSGDSTTIRGVAYTPDGKYLIAIGENWSIYRIRVPLEDLMSEARYLIAQRKTVLRPKDCEAYLHSSCPQDLPLTDSTR